MLRFLLHLVAITAFARPPSAPGLRPLILVPGWGYHVTSLLVKKKSWQHYVRWLIADGYSPDDIHIVGYPYDKGLDAIRDAMIPEIRAILNQYPADTQFDVMGHSLGGFTSLWAIMEGGFAPRVKKFISLSGIPNGWDSWYCAKGVCGQADRELTPFENPFVTQFHAQYAGQIRALEKCSLFSPDDQFVSPYDAGKFEDGTNVTVPGMKHMETIWNREYYDVMRQYCYGASLKK